MSNVTMIEYTVADGNVLGDDLDGVNVEASLNRLASRIDAALRAAYPDAQITVDRANASGAFDELRAESDDPDGWVDDETIEQIKEVADAVWDGGDWYVMDGDR